VIAIILSLTKTLCSRWRMSLPLSFAQKRIASLSGGSADAATSIRFVDQQFIAEIHQYRMVLEIKPTAEDIETAVTRPGAFIGEPTPGE
jgi:hypothetical protein